MFYQVMLRGVLVQKTHFVYKKGLMDSDIWHCKTMLWQSFVFFLF